MSTVLHGVYHVLLIVEIVDSIAESSDAIIKEEVFNTLKGFLK